MCFVLRKPHTGLLRPKGWKVQGCGSAVGTAAVTAACARHEKVPRDIVLEVGVTNVKLSYST